MKSRTEAEGSALIAAAEPDVLVVFAGPEPAPSRRAELRTAPSEPPEQPSLVKKLQDLSVAEGEQMFFMQFPDGLPAAEEAAHGGRSEKEGKVRNHKLLHSWSSFSPRTIHPEPSTPNLSPDVTFIPGLPADHLPPLPLQLLQLHQLPEGFLGKLQIRKSGKVELKLGDVLLDVSEGAAFSFLQVTASV